MTKDISEIMPHAEVPDSETLESIVGETIEIREIILDVPSQFEHMAVFERWHKYKKKRGWYRTTSGVVIKKLQAIFQYRLREGITDPVIARVVKKVSANSGQTYYDLISAERRIKSK